MHFSDETLRRRFPFRARNRADKPRADAAIAEALSKVKDMIRKQVRKALPPWYPREEFEDLHQDCICWLLTKSLPRYDRTRKTKVATFLYRCTFNYLSQQRKVVISRFDANRNRFASGNLDGLAAPDTSIDRHIEHLSRQILEDLPGYLPNRRYVEVAEALIGVDKTTMIHLAKQLGYKLPSSLSTMKRRVHEHLVRAIPLRFDETPPGMSITES